jgi:outer membrane receptor protein involved in Fe transport
MNVSYGNPSLKAEVSHSLELGYSYFTPKFNFSATSNTSFVNNSIEGISEVQPSGAIISTYKNIGKDQRYGLNLYISYRPSDKLNIFFNGGGNYSKMEASNDYTITNEGFSYRGSLGERWTLWKDGSLNAYIGYFSPSITLQGKSPLEYYTSFGVSQYLLKRKLMISLSTFDPFWYQQKYISESKDITFFTRYETTFVVHSASFSVTYNFGKMDLQVKKARRGIQNDDVKSGGSSQGGGSGAGGGAGGGH